MTKTPDKIKKGLECCRNLWDCKNKDCPYLGDGCYPKLHEDFKALVQKLQSENDDLIGENGQLLIEVTLLQAETKQLEAERDAAVRDLEVLCGCMACDHAEKGPDSAPCNECTNCNGAVVESKWQWHGVQKEEADA